MATALGGTLLRHIQRLTIGRGVLDRTDRQLLDEFATRHSEAAFTALVQRHGPMVLRVCRRVLGQDQDAEDAFQATFLVLARRTTSIHKRDALSDWLHGVAFRTAMRAKRSAARRRNHETRRSGAAPVAADSPTWDDVQAVLDEEIQRLPGCFRGAFVLCVMEGKGGSEAAAELGCKEGTVKSRVNRARRLLQRQLSRRGIHLAALLAALSVAESAGRAALPAPLAQLATRFGLAVAAGAPAAVVIPPHVAALAAGVTRAMFLPRIRSLTAVLLAVSLIAAGAGALAHQAAAPPQPPERQMADVRPDRPEAAPRNPPAADDRADAVEVSGRVVDPDGQPVAGARVFFARYILRGGDRQAPTVASDAEGRFRLRVSRIGYPEEYMKATWMRGAVVAVGRGFAFGWTGTKNAEKLTDVTVKLAKELPIQGRVIDLQGRPVAGVSVQVRSVRCREDGGDLKALVESLRAKKDDHGPAWPHLALEPALLDLPRPAVTGADGKFRLTGLSGECLVGVRFAGPTIETAEVYALTRPAPTIVTPRSSMYRSELGDVVYHGSTFDHAAAPTRPVEGVVRDRDSGKPLAGVTIRSRLGAARQHFVDDPYLETTTDDDGRYRLVGLTREGSHRLEVLPAPGQPYMPAATTMAAATGLDPVKVDFALKRGVLLRGRVTDRATGRPVAAVVRYVAFVDNPHVKEASRLRDIDDIETRTDEDGSYTLVALPGRGLLAAKAANRQREGCYVTAAGVDEIKGPRWGDEHFDTAPQPIDPSEFNTLAEVNPARDAASVVQDLAFDPGKTVAGTIVDPDGKPVTGASIDGARGVWLHLKDLPTAEFRLSGVDPKRPRWYLVRHAGQNLGAAVVLKGDEPGPVEIRLQRCATVTGRVVDEDGLPRVAWVTGYVQRGQLDTKEVGVGLGMHGTGKSGRFRIEGIIPGLKIGLLAGKNTTYFDTLVPELTLKEGEVKDVGDVRAKPSE
jgi:RNA polymerase sigma factor (sigma-70 family)